MSRLRAVAAARLVLGLLLVGVASLGAIEIAGESVRGIQLGSLPYVIAAVLEGVFGIALIVFPRWDLPPLLIAWGFLGAWVATASHIVVAGPERACHCLGPVSTTPWLAMAVQGLFVALAGISLRAGLVWGEDRSQELGR